MPTIQRILTEPSTGADLTRLNQFLTFLGEHLSAEDYTRAVNLLVGAFHASAVAPLEAA